MVDFQIQELLLSKMAKIRSRFFNVLSSTSDEFDTVFVVQSKLLKENRVSARKELHGCATISTAPTSINASISVDVGH